jgi:hypothetical protein
MTKKRTIIIIGVSALAALAIFAAAIVGVAAFSVARAASRQSEVPFSSLRLSDASRGVYDRFGPGGRPGAGVPSEDLAEALGISVDELTAAFEQANQAALDKAVADGLITQAQADQIKERGSAFPFGGRGGMWLAGSGIDYQAFLAEALGISVDALEAAQTKAYEARLDQAVADGDLTQEQADLMKGRRALFSSQTFIDAMQGAFEAAVNAGVEAGIITQAQADAILQAQSERGLPGFGGPGGFGDFGRGGRRGHGEGMFPFSLPDAENVTPAP